MHTIQKSALAFPLLILLAFAGASSTNAGDGLFISGTVVGYRTACVNGAHVPQINFQLQARNDGSTPLILLKPSLDFEVRVFFDQSNSAFSGFRYNPSLPEPFAKAMEDDYDHMAVYMSNIDLPTPPARASFVLQPGRYYEFELPVWIKEGFDLPISPNPGGFGAKCEGSPGRPIPEHTSLRLQLRMSPKKHGQSENFFRTLRTKWQSTGTFLLDSNGDVVYRTESILLPNR